MKEIIFVGMRVQAKPQGIYPKWIVIIIIMWRHEEFKRNQIMIFECVCLLLLLWLECVIYTLYIIYDFEPRV